MSRYSFAWQYHTGERESLLMAADWAYEALTDATTHCKDVHKLHWVSVENGWPA